MHEPLWDLDDGLGLRRGRDEPLAVQGGSSRTPFRPASVRSRPLAGRSHSSPVTARTAWSAEEDGPPVPWVREPVAPRPVTEEQSGGTPGDATRLAAVRFVGAEDAPIFPLDEALEEAEFLALAGCVDDSRRTVLGILEQAPGSGPALALLQSLGSDHGPASPRESPAAAAAVRSRVEITGRVHFALGPWAGLDGGNSNEPTPRWFVEPGPQDSGSRAREDSESIYEQGVVYLEIGMPEEATRTFELALRQCEEARVADCRLMLGVSRLRNGLPYEALIELDEVLRTPGLSAERSNEAHFEIGACFELLEEDLAALDHYAQVAKVDPGFRDVRIRVSRLTRALLAAAGDARPGPTGRGAESDIGARRASGEARTG